ncbi:MAG TPA: lamin tail domain-containing protein [Methylomirabilota bacterium]|nr:lamin tail domain-containing protein [Methylomirabilota bacterium]
MKSKRSCRLGKYWLALLVLALFGFPLPIRAQEVVQTNIAHLRTLHTAETYALEDPVTYYSVEGVVTTFVNLADAPSFLFYIQDSSGGMPVFWRNAAFAPAAGDMVRVTARLAQFNGLTELVPNGTDPSTEVTILDPAGAPLPTPKLLDLRSTPTQFELLEGSFVVVSNVYLDPSGTTFNRSGETVFFMESASGSIGAMRVDRRSPLAGQPKPKDLVTIFGVMGQFDSSSPYDSGYQIFPTRLEHLVAAEHKPPLVAFTNILSNLVRPGIQPTNTFTETALLPGETLRIEFSGKHLENVPFTLRPGPGAPVDVVWQLPRAEGTELSGAVEFTAAPVHSGTAKVITLEAATAHATNLASWRVYIPSPVEQGIVLTEFLANPAPPSVAYPNPLNRAERPPATSQDEYVELVNFGSSAVDLSGWTIGDTLQIRHLFSPGTILQAAQAAVVYGGPLTGLEPVLPAGVLVMPTSHGGELGFGLNNSGGDTISVRNAQNELILRVQYTGLPSTGSLSRVPDRDGAFVPQNAAGAAGFTPGLRASGEAWMVVADSVGAVQISVQPDTIRLHWASLPGRSYRVLATADLSIGFEVVASDLTFANGVGEFVEPAASGQRFYRIEMQQ